MGSSREPPSAHGPAASGSAHDAAPADADATVISGRASGGSLSTTDIGRLLEGRRLGAYQLEQFIGGGGMGAVFRALDTTLDRVVAVKVLSRQQSADEEMLRRFRNEAQSAARLDHENISRVHAVGSDDGWHFIVFEFIDGTNLRDIVREAGPFSASRVINVSIQVADALEHASDRDVVHRDIKPSNIIITPGGRARLVDMGLARLLHVDTREDLTASGMTLGTFDYISPEQARDPRSADVRSDLYSLGCTMFFMLVGRPPFAEGTMVQKLLQHQQSPPPAIDDLRPDVPHRLAGVVARLMAKDPADRHQRPADLIADLLGIAEEEDIDISSSRSPTVAAVVPAGPPAGDRGSPLPWLVPVAGLVGLVAWLWWTSAGTRGTAPRPAPAPDARPATTAGAAAPTTPWRVVDTPRDERDLATLAEAVRRAGNGDVIELAYDGVRDERPFSAATPALTVRAAPDRSPTIRFPMPLTGESSREQPPAAWPVASGVLTLERVRIVLVPGGPAGTALFALADGATLACEDCRLEVEEDDAPFDTSAAAAATLVRLDSTATGTATRGEVRMTRTVAIGAGQFLRVGGDRSTDVTWFGGRCILGDAFLVAEGGEDADGPATSLSLAEGAFACRGGFARLLDSPARPALPSLRVIADACRFAVPDGHALLEQTGVDEPDHYRAVVEWLDAGGRYEGSGVFRRIDGAGERVEIDYSSAGQPLVHSATIDPDIADWWSGDPDS